MLRKYRAVGEGHFFEMRYPSTSRRFVAIFSHACGIRFGPEMYNVSICRSDNNNVIWSGGNRRFSRPPWINSIWYRTRDHILLDNWTSNLSKTQHILVDCSQEKPRESVLFKSTGSWRTIILSDISCSAITEKGLLDRCENRLIDGDRKRMWELGSFSVRSRAVYANIEGTDSFISLTQDTSVCANIFAVCPSGISKASLTMTIDPYLIERGFRWKSLIGIEDPNSFLLTTAPDSCLFDWLKSGKYPGDLANVHWALLRLSVS